MKVVSLNLSLIPADKLRKVKTKDGKDCLFVSVAIADRDKPDNYGNDVSCWINQSEEERTAKTPKIYIGNGKSYGATVATSNPFAPVADTNEQPQQTENNTAGNSDDAPF